jgi:hypothetical protein
MVSIVEIKLSDNMTSELATVIGEYNDKTFAFMPNYIMIVPKKVIEPFWEKNKISFREYQVSGKEKYFYPHHRVMMVNIREE